MVLRPTGKNGTCHGTAASLVWNLRFFLLISPMESWFVGWEMSVLDCEGKGASHRIRTDGCLFRKRNASFCRCKGETPNKCICIQTNMGWVLAPVLTKPPTGNDWDRRKLESIFQVLEININVDHTSYDVFGVHESVGCNKECNYIRISRFIVFEEQRLFVGGVRRKIGASCECTCGSHGFL